MRIYGFHNFLIVSTTIRIIEIGEDPTVFALSHDPPYENVPGGS
jgi:hypothetical protein